MILDFQEDQISKSAERLGMDLADVNVKELARLEEQSVLGSNARRIKDQANEAADKAISQVKGEAKEMGADLLNARVEASRNYREYVGKMQQLMDFLGVGNWKGTGSLVSKLEELTAEQIIKKFSTKGDVEGLKFLQAEFPQVAELVRQYETKKFLSQAVKSEAGEIVLDSKKLAGAIEKLRKDSPEMVEYLLPNGAADAVDAAKVIHDSLTRINQMKDSGTPGGIAKIFKHGLGTAMGAVGWMVGQNPISAALIGEMAQRLAVNGPQQVRLAWLKYLASNKEVSAPGFKAMVDFATRVIKEQNNIKKATGAVFKSGVQVVASNTMPTQKDRDKLQKQLDVIQQNPESMLAGHQDDGLGHYMPDQQTAIAASATKAAQYLESIRPKPFKPGPLDPEIPPSKGEMARYNRALDIAINPITVLDSVKQGTLQITDIQDLKSMYPALYHQYSRELMDQVSNMQANEEPIPYATKMGISLFLTSPLDASMKPQSIMSAQPRPTPAAPPHQASPVKPKKSTAPLSKTPGQYMTPTQKAISNDND